MKTSQCGASSQWVEPFLRYSYRNWYKNWYHYFHGAYDHRISRHVHLDKLTQMELIKHVLVTPSRQYHVTLQRYYNFHSARTMIIKFVENSYEVWQPPFIKLCDTFSRKVLNGHKLKIFIYPLCGWWSPSTRLYDPLIMLSCKGTWQTKLIIYPLSQTPCPSALVSCAPVVFPVDKFAEISSLVPNYASLGNK